VRACTRVLLCIHTCDMTHSYMCRDSFVRVAWGGGGGGGVAVGGDGGGGGALAHLGYALFIRVTCIML